MVFVDRGMNIAVMPQTRSGKQLHQFAGKMMLLSYSSGKRVETVETVPWSLANHYV